MVVICTKTQEIVDGYIICYNIFIKISIRLFYLVFIYSTFNNNKKLDIVYKVFPNEH